MSDTLISDKVEKSNDKSRAKEDGGKVAERCFDYFYSFSIISQKYSEYDCTVNVIFKGGAVIQQTCHHPASWGSGRSW